MENDESIDREICSSQEDLDDLTDVDDDSNVFDESPGPAKLSVNLSRRMNSAAAGETGFDFWSSERIKIICHSVEQNTQEQPFINPSAEEQCKTDNAGSESAAEDAAESTNTDEIEPTTVSEDQLAPEEEQSNEQVLGTVAGELKAAEQQIGATGSAISFVASMLDRLQRSSRRDLNANDASSVRDANGNVIGTVTSRDDQGRMQVVSYLNGDRDVYSYSPDGNICRRYDGAGQLLQAEHRGTNGLLQQRSVYSADGQLDYRQEFRYENGLCVRETYSRTGRHVSTAQFNAGGQIIRTTRFDPNGHPIERTDYSYVGADCTATTRDASNRILSEARYDASGNYTAITYFNPTNGLRSHTDHYSYGNNGQLNEVRRVLSGGQVDTFSYVYHSNHLTRVDCVSHDGTRESHHYNTSGHETRIVQQSAIGRVVDYQFGRYGAATQVTTVEPNGSSVTASVDQQTPPSRWQTTEPAHYEPGILRRPDRSAAPAGADTTLPPVSPVDIIQRRWHYRSPQALAEMLTRPGGDQAILESLASPRLDIQLAVLNALGNPAAGKLWRLLATNAELRGRIIDTIIGAGASSNPQLRAAAANALQRVADSDPQMRTSWLLQPGNTDRGRLLRTTAIHSLFAGTDPVPGNEGASVLLRLARNSSTDPVVRHECNLLLERALHQEQAIDGATRDEVKQYLYIAPGRNLSLIDDYPLIDKDNGRSSWSIEQVGTGLLIDDYLLIDEDNGRSSWSVEQVGTGSLIDDYQYINADNASSDEESELDPPGDGDSSDAATRSSWTVEQAGSAGEPFLSTAVVPSVESRTGDSLNLMHQFQQSIEPAQRVAIVEDLASRVLNGDRSADKCLRSLLQTYLSDNTATREILHTVMQAANRAPVANLERIVSCLGSALRPSADSSGVGLQGEYLQALAQRVRELNDSESTEQCCRMMVRLLAAQPEWFSYTLEGATLSGYIVNELDRLSVPGSDTTRLQAVITEELLRAVPPNTVANIERFQELAEILQDTTTVRVAVDAILLQVMIDTRATRPELYIAALRARLGCTNDVLPMLRSLAGDNGDIVAVVNDLATYLRSNGAAGNQAATDLVGALTGAIGYSEYAISDQLQLMSCARLLAEFATSRNLFDLRRASEALDQTIRQAQQQNIPQLRAAIIQFFMAAGQSNDATTRAAAREILALNGTRQASFPSALLNRAYADAADLEPERAIAFLVAAAHLTDNVVQRNDILANLHTLCRPSSPAGADRLDYLISQSVQTSRNGEAAEAVLNMLAQEGGDTANLIVARLLSIAHYWSTSNPVNRAASEELVIQLRTLRTAHPAIAEALRLSPGYRQIADRALASGPVRNDPVLEGPAFALFQMCQSSGPLSDITRGIALASLTNMAATGRVEDTMDSSSPSCEILRNNTQQALLALLRLLESDPAGRDVRHAITQAYLSNPQGPAAAFAFDLLLRSLAPSSPPGERLGDAVTALMRRPSSDATAARILAAIAFGQGADERQSSFAREALSRFATPAVLEQLLLQAEANPEDLVLLRTLGELAVRCRNLPPSVVEYLRHVVNANGASCGTIYGVALPTGEAGARHAAAFQALLGLPGTAHWDEQMVDTLIALARAGRLQFNQDYHPETVRLIRELAPSLPPELQRRLVEECLRSLENRNGTRAEFSQTLALLGSFGCCVTGEDLIRLQQLRQTLPLAATTDVQRFELNAQILQTLLTLGRSTAIGSLERNIVLWSIPRDDQSVGRFLLPLSYWENATSFAIESLDADENRDAALVVLCRMERFAFVRATNYQLDVFHYNGERAFSLADSTREQIADILQTPENVSRLFELDAEHFLDRNLISMKIAAYARIGESELEVILRLIRDQLIDAGTTNGRLIWLCGLLEDMGYAGTQTQRHELAALMLQRSDSRNRRLVREQPLSSMSVDQRDVFLETILSLFRPPVRPVPGERLCAEQHQERDESTRVGIRALLDLAWQQPNGGPALAVLMRLGRGLPAALVPDLQSAVLELCDGSHEMRAYITQELLRPPSEEELTRHCLTGAVVRQPFVVFGPGSTVLMSEWAMMTLNVLRSSHRSTWTDLFSLPSSRLLNLSGVSLTEVREVLLGLPRSPQTSALTLHIIEELSEGIRLQQVHSEQIRGGADLIAICSHYAANAQLEDLEGISRAYRAVQKFDSSDSRICQTQLANALLRLYATTGDSRIANIFLESGWPRETAAEYSALRAQIIQGLVRRALNGDSVAREHLAMQARYPDSQQEIQNAVLRGYRPQDSHQLPFVVAVMVPRHMASAMDEFPRAANPQEAAQQFRHALSQLETALLQRIGNLNGLSEQERNQRIAQAGPLLDVLALAAASGTGYSSEAATRLINFCVSAGRGSREQASYLWSAVVSRLNGLVEAQGLSTPQCGYLLNLSHHFMRLLGSSTSIPYVHQPLSPARAADLVNWANANFATGNAVPPYARDRERWRAAFEMIAAGAFGDEARTLLACSSFVGTESGGMRLNSAQQQSFQSLLGALRSADTATVERAMTPANLGRLALQAASDPASRLEIINLLSSLAGNQQIRGEVREQALLALAGVISSALERNPNDIREQLMQQFIANAACREALMSIATSLQGSAQSAEQARRIILAASRLNETSRVTVLNLLMSARFLNGNGAPLVAAILDNRNEVPSSAEASCTIVLTLARNGNQQAIDYLIARGATPDRLHVTTPQSFDRRAMFDAAWEIVCAGSFLSADRISFSHTQLDWPDCGLGQLVRELGLCATGTDAEGRQRAIAALAKLATNENIPPEHRQRAIDQLVSASGADWPHVQAQMQSAMTSAIGLEAAVLLYARVGAGTAECAGDARLALEALITGIVRDRLPPASDGADLQGTVIGPAMPLDMDQLMNSLQQRLDQRQCVRIALALASDPQVSNSIRARACQMLLQACESSSSSSSHIVSAIQASLDRQYNPVAVELLARASNWMTAREATSMLQQILTAPGAAGGSPGDNSMALTSQSELQRLIEVLRPISAGAQSGNRANIEQLVCSLTNDNLPGQVRMWAVEQLRLVAASGQSGALAEVLRQRWEATHHPQIYEMLACLAAAPPTEGINVNTGELRQILTAGYIYLITETPGVTAAQLHARRATAAIALLGNPELLSPQIIEMLVGNMTPEFAGAFASARHLPPHTAAQFLQALRRQMAEGVADSNIIAFAQAVGSLCGLANTEDVLQLERLRTQASSEPQRLAIDRALFNMIAQSPNRAVPCEALAIFRASSCWQTLSDDQRRALEQYATTGLCDDLSALKGAYDRVQGAGARYPLAVALQSFSLPASLTDAEICQLAARIQSHCSVGGARTYEGWVVPLLTSAMLAFDRRDARISIQDKDQFMLAVLNDLAAGELHPSRQFLNTYCQNLNEQLQTLERQQNQLLESLQQAQRDMTPDALRNALQMLERAHQGVLDAQQFSSVTLGPQTGALNGSRERFIEACATLRQQLERAGENRAQLVLAFENLRRELLEVEMQITELRLANMQAEHVSLVANHRGDEADALLLQYLAQGLSSSSYMNGQLQNLWSRLQERGLAPVSSLPDFSAPNACSQARETLLSIMSRTDLSALDPQSRLLHMLATQALTDACLRQIMRDSSITHMSALNETIVLRVTTLMEHFEVALGSSGSDTREQLRDAMRRELDAILQQLETEESRAAIAALGTTISNLQTTAYRLPPGSPVRLQLEEQIRVLENLREALRPGGQQRAELEHLRNQLNDGVLDDRSWQEFRNTLIHIAAATAAFALATAVTTSTCGAGAPLAALIVAPLFTMVTRHVTQEVLFQSGLDQHGSIIGDWHRGEFRGTNGQFLELLAHEFKGEAVSNAAFFLVGRVFSGLGSRWSGGTFAGGVFANPHTAMGFVQGLRQEFNPLNFARSFGWGVATEAPNIAGIEHGGEIFGYALAAWHGFSSGVHNPVHNMRTVANRLQLTPTEIAHFEHQLSGVTHRQAILDALAHIPLNQRATILAAHWTGIHQLSELLHMMPDPGSRAAFLHGFLEMTPAARQQLLELRTSIPASQQADLAHILSRLPDRQSIESIVATLHNVPDRIRLTCLANWRNAPPELLVALSQLAGTQSRARLMEDLHETVGSPNFARTFQDSLGRLNHQQRVALLENLAAQPRPGLSRLFSLLCTENGARVVESLLLMPDARRRQAVLEHLTVLPEGHSMEAINTFGTTGDAHSRADLLSLFAIYNSGYSLERGHFSSAGESIQFAIHICEHPFIEMTPQARRAHLERINQALDLLAGNPGDTVAGAEMRRRIFEALRNNQPLPDFAAVARGPGRPPLETFPRGMEPRVRETLPANISAGGYQFEESPPARQVMHEIETFTTLFLSGDFAGASALASNAATLRSHAEPAGPVSTHAQVPFDAVAFHRNPETYMQNYRARLAELLGVEPSAAPRPHMTIDGIQIDMTTGRAFLPEGTARTSRHQQAENLFARFRDGGGGRTIIERDVPFDLAAYRSNPNPEQYMRDYLESMTRQAHVNFADNGGVTATLPRPVMTVEGVRVDMTTGLAIDTPRTPAHQRAEDAFAAFRNSHPAHVRRIIAERALCAMEERLHLQQSTLGDYPVSRSYARFVSETIPVGDHLAQGFGPQERRNAVTREQELILALHDAGWPTSLLRHHFGGHHTAAREPVFRWLEGRDAIARIGSAETRARVERLIEQATSPEVRRALIEQMPEIVQRYGQGADLPRRLEQLRDATSIVVEGMGRTSSEMSQILRVLQQTNPQIMQDPLFRDIADRALAERVLNDPTLLNAAGFSGRINELFNAMTPLNLSADSAFNRALQLRLQRMIESNLPTDQLPLSRMRTLAERFNLPEALRQRLVGYEPTPPRGMQVQGQEVVDAFMTRHPQFREDARFFEQSLQRLMDNRYRNANDLADNFGRKKSGKRVADVVANNMGPESRFVIDVHGNAYRMVVDVNFATGATHVVWVGTHSQYDAVNSSPGIANLVRR